MVPFNLKVLAKFWPLLGLLAKLRWVLACLCLQNFCRFSLKFPAVQGKRNLHLGNKNWHWKLCFGKHVHTLNISWKMLPRFVDVLLKPTGLSSVSGSRVTLPETFCLWKRAVFNPLEIMRRTLLACKQGLRKLQILINVYPLSLVKLREVILHKTAYQKGIVA